MKPTAINRPCFRPPLLLVCVPRHNPCFLAKNGLFSGLSLVSLPNARTFSLTVRATENSNQVIFLISTMLKFLDWCFTFLLLTIASQNLTSGNLTGKKKERKCFEVSFLDECL